MYEVREKKEKKEWKEGGLKMKHDEGGLDLYVACFR